MNINNKNIMNPILKKPNIVNRANEIRKNCKRKLKEFIKYL